LPSSATLEKGLSLLDHVIRDQGRTAFADLARDLSIPISTAHRLLALLEERRLVVRVGKGRYRGGGALLDLAGDTDLATILRQTARPFLREIARETGRTAHLGVLDDGMVTYLIKEQGGPAILFTQEGMQLEAYCSGIGKMLLSTLDPAELDVYLADGPFIALTKGTVTAPERLREILIDVRRQDYALDDREVAEDLFCLAVPLRSRSDRTVAAISLSGPAEDFDRGTIAALTDTLSRCARQIAEQTWYQIDQNAT
jgi:DNA-binding IclR family transcriptional regulator